jgi:hypothetical protein
VGEETGVTHPLLGTPRERWQAGWCPCCGMDTVATASGTQPAPIGEGVLMCGWCVESCHNDDDHVVWLLKAILTGDTSLQARARAGP